MRSQNPTWTFASLFRKRDGDNSGMWSGSYRELAILRGSGGIRVYRQDIAIPDFCLLLNVVSYTQKNKKQ